MIVSQGPVPKVKLVHETLRNAILDALPTSNFKLLCAILYGSSVGPGFKVESDCDVVFVSDDFLPMPSSRRDQFTPMEELINSRLDELAAQGIKRYLSPLLKTRTELDSWNPIYLDMVDKSLVLYDPLNLARHHIQKVDVWIKGTGTRKVQRGLKWYWIYGEEPLDTWNRIG